MKIRDLMTPGVESCTRDADLAAAAMIMWRHDCGVVPVVDDDRRVVGVVTDRDICMATATRHRRPEEVVVGEVISSDAFTVGAHEDVRKALDTMRERRVRRLPVVDADGRLAGILSLNDLVLHAQPARPRTHVDLSVQEVFDVMATVCRHPALAPREPESEPVLVG